MVRATGRRRQAGRCPGTHPCFPKVLEVGWARCGKSLECGHFPRPPDWAGRCRGATFEGSQACQRLDPCERRGSVAERRLNPARGRRPTGDPHLWFAHPSGREPLSRTVLLGVTSWRDIQLNRSVGSGTQAERHVILFIVFILSKRGPCPPTTRRCARHPFQLKSALPKPP